MSRNYLTNLDFDLGLSADYYDDNGKWIYYDSFTGHFEFKVYENGNIEIQKPDNIGYVVIKQVVPFVNYRGELDLTEIKYCLYLGKKINNVSHAGFADLGGGNTVYIPDELKKKAQEFAFTKFGLFCLGDNDAVFPSKEKLFESVYNIIKTVSSQYYQTNSNIEEENFSFHKH